MLGAGSELGHYRIVRRLGKGGMAEVYEAEDLNLGRHVALKVLPQELTRDPQMVARFRTEVRSAAGMNHRNIVTVFEVGEHEGMQFYAMRLLTGGDLRDRIGDGMRATEALAILKELAGAFEHAHSRGFVHRDMKPENVMFDDEGVPVLTDFGISKALGGGSQMTATGVVIGTPRYFSPEQARGRPVDARSDLYSLGVTFYEMLTGTPPYDGKDIITVVQQHVNDPVPELPRKHAQLQPLIDQMMAKNPDQRIASAKALRMAIAAIGAPGPARAASEEEEPEAQEPEDRPRSSSMAATRLVRQVEPESEPEAEPESVPAPWETESEPQQLADDDAPIDLGVPQPGLVESQQFPAQDDTRRSPWLFVAAGAALMIVSAAATWWVVAKKSGPEPAPQVPAAPAAQVATPPPTPAPVQPEALQATPAATPAVVEAPAPTPAAPVAVPVPAPAAAPAAKPPKAAKSAPTPSPKTPVPTAQPAAENAPAPTPAPTAAPAAEPEPAPAPAPAAEPAPAPAPEQSAPPPIEEPPAAKPEPAPAEPAPEPKSGEELDSKPDAPAPAP